MTASYIIIESLIIESLAFKNGRGVAQGDFGLVLAPPKPVKGTRKRGYDAPERRGAEKIC